MFLIVRDEDVPTVAAAINAYAIEEGLEVEPAEDEAARGNPLALLAALARPRAFVSMGEDSVVVNGLDSLDLAEADEWASRLSTECNTEVIALDIAEDGVRVFIFDDGELEDQVEVPLGAGGVSTAVDLAPLVDSDEGKRELTVGIAASSAGELAEGLLRCFGVSSFGEDGVVLSFRDPVDHQPTLQVEAVPGAMLTGSVGREIHSPFGYVFAVSLVGGDPIEGCRISLGGGALALISVDAVDVALRVRGAEERAARRFRPELGTDGRLSIAIEDAVLERIDMAAPSFDVGDMFGSMQRLMSSTEAQQRNLLLVGVSARGVRAGGSDLVLEVSPLAGEAEAAQGSVAVKIT